MTPSKKTPAKVVKQDNGAKAPQYENKILDTSSIGVLITRISDGTILYANQAIANLLGIPDIGPVIGAPVPNFYWDPEERLVVIQRFRAEGSISQYPLRTRRADDSMLWVTISIQPFSFEGEQVLLTEIVDISERKRAENLLQTMIENAPEAVGIVDLTTGLFKEPNENAVKLYCLSREELVKVGPAQMSPPLQPDGRPSDEKAMEQINLAMQGEFPVFEWTHRNARGENIPCEVRLARLQSSPPQVRFTVTDITERKAAQATLLESEERFRRFTEATSEGLVFHEQGRIIDANPAGLAMFGLSDHKEFVGKSLLEFVVPESHQTVLKQMQLENVQPYEIQCIRKDRSTFPVETSTRTYKIGDLTTRATSIRDITKRKQAEAELRKNELLLSNAIHIAQMGYWDLDIDTQMFIFNDQYYRTFHATTTEEMGGNQMSVMDFIQRFIPPGEGDIIGSGMQEAIETKDPNFQTKLEAQNLTVQGELRWVSVWLTVEKDEHGRTIKLHGVNQDITERKQAERKLQENQQLLQLVMDNIPQAVFWKDKELTYLGANQAFTEDAGFTSPQELVGKNDFDMPWKEQAELYRADDQQILDIGEAKLNYEEPQTGPTGKVTWLRTSKIPMRDGDGKVFAILGMYEDITEWKRLQQQVQEAFERRGYQVQVGTEISQEVAAASQLNDLFDRVVTLTKERLGYYHTQLLRYDDARDAVVLINGYGEIGQKMLAGGHQMPMGEGLIGTAAASGETVLRPTLADDPDWHSNPLLPDTQGEIAVPIKWQNTVLGVLDVQSNQAGALSDEDRLLLEGLCGQIAIAMHSAELVEAIRQNEANLAEALRTARLANWEYDVEKAVFIFNDQFYSVFHTTAEKAGGYQLSSARYAELFVHPDDLEFVRKEIGRSLNSTERVFNNTLDHRILYGDGGIGYITAKVTVERDENGKMTRYYGANQDITERKQAEEALRINEARLAEALEIARLAHWEYDVEKDIFTFNDQFYSLFHSTAEQHGGYQLPSAYYAQHFVYSDDLPVVGVEIEKALNSTERHYSRDIEHRILYADGGIGYMQVNINVERDENGKITRYYGANQDITERKLAEEALRINEAHLAEALLAARLAYWEYDVEKDIFTFNDQFYSIFHTTAEKAGGYQISSARYAELFVHPDDMEVVGTEIGKALSSTERVYNATVDHRIVYEDGGIGYVMVQLTVERDENGKITRYYGANQDITERKQAEEALRINETRLAEALRAARLGNWEYDFANDLFIFTDDFYSIFRTSAEKVGGYKISSADYSRNFVHPDDASLVGIEIQKVLDAKDRLFTTHLEHRIIFSDGEVGHIAVNINVERDENGKITRWYGANQDITERKQAEEALRINEALLAEALEIARLAHWEYDVEKDIFTFNDQFYSLFHATAEQHGGYQLPSAYYAQHFVYSDDLPVVGVEIEKALNSTERHYSRDVEHRFLYADGGLGHMQVNINVERDENGKITRYYGANQDITERTKVQHELAERLEEINRLYQNLSHEGWKNYRNTADLPTGFMHDQTGVKPVDEAALADEPFDNIPIRVLGGEVVGTLTVANDPRNPTSPEDVTFLQQVSDQIALALESARLSAQTQSALAQSEILFEASKNLAQATDLQELVSTSVNTLNIPEINRAIMVAFNYDSTGDLEDMGVIANWWNGSGHEVTAIGTHYPREVFRLLPMFVSPVPVFFNDSFNDERADSITTELLKKLDVRAGAVLPLLSGTHQIGALILESEEPHQFTQDETRLYSALAPQITTVLENRRQFERAQQQAQRESTLNVISQKIQSATTVEAVLQIAARELGHALGAPMTIAQLSMKDKK